MSGAKKAGIVFKRISIYGLFIILDLGLFLLASTLCNLAFENALTGLSLAGLKLWKEYNYWLYLIFAIIYLLLAIFVLLALGSGSVKALKRKENALAWVFFYEIVAIMILVIQIVLCVTVNPNIQITVISPHFIAAVFPFLMLLALWLVLVFPPVKTKIKW
ncbi:hypothetical protein FACS189490_10740 [Clostridia bacterium]|nr:hypothetical protein FACS189490_10740 [Clostridia bacterium]